MSIRHISTLRIKHRALATTLAIATFLVIVATAACGSDSTERDAVDSVPTATTSETAAGTIESAPMTSEAAGRSTTAQGTPRSTISDYLAVCDELTPDPDAEEISFQELKTATREFTNEFKQVNPPEEFTELHELWLEYFDAFNESLEGEPAEGQSEDDYYLPRMFQFAIRFQIRVQSLMESMDPHLRAELVEAGCMEAEDLPTELQVGETIEASLEQPETISYFSFQAIKGERYLVTVEKGSLTDLGIGVDRPTTDIPELSHYVSEDEKVSARWQAPETATYTFVVFSRNEQTGSFRVSVTLDLSPSIPANAQYAWDDRELQVLAGTLLWEWERRSILVTWDAVDGADYYNVYRAFRDTGSREELATNLTENSYVDTSPGVVNYYWVKACNDAGCSDVDTKNPASPVEGIPDQPANVQVSHQDSANIISWDSVNEADYYVIYGQYSPTESSSIRSCSEGDYPIRPDGGCQVLHLDLRQTHYTSDQEFLHFRNAYYWVTACNRGGCSKIDSDNPAIDAP